MTTALVPVADLDRMATAVAASKLFGMQSKEQALALMLVAQAEGLHPATAARDYHIIQGRPALKADAMLARYLASGGKVEWHEHTDAKVAATFSHPQGGSLRIDWDMERAKKAGLGDKDMWKKYPRQMLRARVISEGIRATNPAVAVGMYTPEEIQDFEPAKGQRGAKAKNMGDAEVVQPEQSESTAPAAAAAPSTPPPDDGGGDAGATLMASPEQIEAMHTALSENNVTQEAILAKAEIRSLSDMPADEVPNAIRWIKKQGAKK